MFSDEARTVITDILELFARSSLVPIELYVFDNECQLLDHVSAKEVLHAPYCQAIWSLNGGNGRKCCNRNMQHRAVTACRSNAIQTTLCHAGLMNVSHPFSIAPDITGVLQFGGFLPKEAPVQDSRASLAAQHSLIGALVASLNLPETTIADLEATLHAEAPRRSAVEWEWVQSLLPPILTRIISQFVLKVERDKKQQEGSFHELQIRLQATLSESENILSTLPISSPLRTNINNLIGANNATSLVLTNLTRGEYLPEEFNFEMISINDLVTNALKLCTAEAESKDIIIIKDLKPNDGSTEIEVSRSHIHVALSNIFQNAIKYSYSTTAKSGQRYLTVRGKPTGDNFYSLVVTNYGVGIEKCEIDNIFEDGYRGTIAKLESRSGGGQGLWLTKNMIDRHGGSISITSEPESDNLESKRIPYRTQVVTLLPIRQKSDQIQRDMS
jgi:signal transduction histidine kinase